MKRIILTFALLFTITTVFTSCRDEKTTKEKVEDTFEEAGDEIEDAAEDTKDAVKDASEEVKDAAKEAKENVEDKLDGDE
ncbi:hypothetical protein GCM10022271_21530 [Corallibacter vietnamensis]|uniref:YtxH domain-containing protein n=1 Tax=Corallibacter vietnamensis TaxID=904130 RepID=A0ABP7H906_9FLAO